MLQALRCIIMVLLVCYVRDLNRSFKDGFKFEAKLMDGQVKAFANQIITFNINGVFYDRTTDNEGIARLNINLMAGKYIITSMYSNVRIIFKYLRIKILYGDNLLEAYLPFIGLIIFGNIENLILASQGVVQGVDVKILSILSIIAVIIWLVIGTVATEFAIQYANYITFIGGLAIVILGIQAIYEAVKNIRAKKIERV